MVYFITMSLKVKRMNKIKKRYIRIAGLFFIIYCLAWSCITALSSELLESPVKHARNFKTFPLDMGKPLISRVQPVPDFVLKAWREWDEKPGYHPYMPDEAEMRIIGEYIELLPPLVKSVMKERMLGIYFVNNLLGSGLTDWVIDDRNNIYTYMIFNPSTLKKNISELVTWKEETCFIKNDGDIRVRIDLDSNMKGFYYILLHEATHIVDYVQQITPYTEPDIKRFIKNPRETTDFTLQVWKGYQDTAMPQSFRSGITFYGFGRGPKINITDARGIYEDLSRSPFISLYGAQNWAEDLAELLTFYHLTNKMGMSYRIAVFRGETVLYRSNPAENPYVKARFPQLERFYRVTPGRKKGN